MRRWSASNAAPSGSAKHGCRLLLCIWGRGLRSIETWICWGPAPRRNLGQAACGGYPPQKHVLLEVRDGVVREAEDRAVELLGEGERAGGHGEVDVLQAYWGGHGKWVMEGWSDEKQETQWGTEISGPTGTGPVSRGPSRAAGSLHTTQYYDSATAFAARTMSAATSSGRDAGV